MNHMPESEHTQTYTFKDFLPLIVIASIIITLTVGHQLYYGFDLMQASRIFMALFFLIFGSFKIMKLKDFATAYAEYDIIAKRFFWYGYLYPFIELGLGIAYLFNIMPKAIDICTLILMLISAIGVFIELHKGRTIVCACLGTVFKLPMTWVTLSEDLLMAVMALISLLI